MIRFIIRRLLVSIPVLIGVVAVVFVLTRVIPGDPCVAALGEKANPTTCFEFRQRFGLNEPLPVQFLIYMGDLATGNLGDSIKTGEPVTQILVERMPTTIELTVYALLFAIIVGVPLGIVSAYRRNSKTDVGTMAVANLGVSIPVFVLGLVIAYIFAIVLKDTPFSLPPSGRLTAGFDFKSIPEAWGLPTLAGPPRTVLDFLSNMYTLNGLVTGQWNLLVDAFRHMILPAIALGHDPDGDHRAHDPIVAARGAGPGLRAHCPRQGHEATHRDVPPRVPERTAADRHGHRPCPSARFCRAPC